MSCRSHFRPWRRPAVLSAAWPAALIVLLCLGAGGCSRWTSRWTAGADAGVAARVNGQAIPQSELDTLYASQTSGASQPLSDDQMRQTKLALLNQLVDRHILLQYAAHEGIAADPREVDRGLEAERARDPNLSADAAREQVSQDLVLNHLLEREVGAKVQVSDDAVAEFYRDNPSSFNSPERQYHVLEIVVTPSPAPVTNLAEDKATSAAAAHKKIQMLQTKLAQKADFAGLAQQYSEDPSTASSGGDLGLIPQSVLLSQTPPALRDAILALRAGQVSPVVQSGGSSYLLKLLEIEPAGLRPLSDPQVQQSIRDLLSGARRQVLQAAFLTMVRDQAKVENYYARQVFTSGDTDTP